MRLLKPRIRTADTRSVRPPKKTADEVYRTSEYRAWREGVIARSGGQCQDPAHDPANPRAGITLFADHVRELRDGGSPFDPANGMARCGACHSRKTAAERAKRMAAPAEEPRYLRGAATRPEWLRPSRVPLVIVCGPPGAGKSTYVREHAGQGDLLIDLDLIASKLSGQPAHAWDSSRWLDPAIRARNDILGRLSSPRARWPRAWFIIGAPEASERQWWQRKLRPERIVVLAVSDDVCLARLAADPARQARAAAIATAVHQWWNRYTPRVGDEVVGCLTDPRVQRSVLV